jgi:hypothetical protein
LFWNTHHGHRAVSKIGQLIVAQRGARRIAHTDTGSPVELSWRKEGGRTVRWAATQ